MAKRSDVKQEMEKMPYEPLLPIEKSLILWSLGIGAVLMVVLIWASYRFFPAG
jgi:hypothetical protein